MTSIIRHAHWVILKTKRPRIWTQPTQFQNLSEISKNEFPGNWTKTWISTESAWFTDSFPIFENKKIAHGKKFWRFLIPEFNLNINKNCTYLFRWVWTKVTAKNPSFQNIYRTLVSKIKRIKCKWIKTTTTRLHEYNFLYTNQNETFGWIFSTS